MNTNYLKDFVPHEPSLALKELGFDEPCMCFYNNRKELKVYHNADKDWNTLEHQLLGNSKITLPNTYSAPTYSQAFRFFREKYMLLSSEVYDRGLDNSKLPIVHSYSFRIFNLNNFEDFYSNTFKTYEEAELECLKNLIEIVKQKQ